MKLRSSVVISLISLLTLGSAKAAFADYPVVRRPCSDIVFLTSYKYDTTQEQPTKEIQDHIAVFQYNGNSHSMMRLCYLNLPNEVPRSGGVLVPPTPDQPFAPKIFYLNSDTSKQYVLADLPKDTITDLLQEYEEKIQSNPPIPPLEVDKIGSVTTDDILNTTSSTFKVKDVFLNNINDITIQFAPYAILNNVKTPISLANLAAALNVNHFNWLQRIDNLPKPSYSKSFFQTYILYQNDKAVSNNNKILYPPLYDGNGPQKICYETFIRRSCDPVVGIDTYVWYNDVPQEVINGRTTTNMTYMRDAPKGFSNGTSSFTTALYGVRDNFQLQGALNLSSQFTVQWETNYSLAFNWEITSLVPYYKAETKILSINGDKRWLLSQ